MSSDRIARATWRSRALVLLHFGYWVLEWISNSFQFAWFLVRRRRIQAEMRELIVTDIDGADTMREEGDRPSPDPSMEP